MQGKKKKFKTIIVILRHLYIHNSVQKFKFSMLYFNTGLLVLKLISYISFIVRRKMKKCTDMNILYIPIYLIFKYLLKRMQQKLLE